jgi:hypothetical protein
MLAIGHFAPVLRPVEMGTHGVTYLRSSDHRAVASTRAPVIQKLDTQIFIYYDFSVRTISMVAFLVSITVYRRDSNYHTKLYS